MKIAVVSIAKNEANHVNRWAESCKDADIRIICDTGSEDDTVRKAREAGVTTHQLIMSQWRFDHARNYALSKIPDWVDYVIWLDMDEVLQPGWGGGSVGTQTAGSGGSGIVIVRYLT